MPYSFNFPQITQMTKVQQSVLDQTEAVAISGGPGTGKSVVSLWRHIRNHQTGQKKSIILTYTKTLAHYLAASASEISKDAGRHVFRTFDWMAGKAEKCDELIIDEAQDVDRYRYDELKDLAATVCYGADDQQMLFPQQQTTQEQLEEFFPNNHPYELDQNFRNSYEILLFVSALFPDYLISHNILETLRVNRSAGIKPQCIITKNNEAVELQAIINIINEFRSDGHNIGILVPLQQHVDQYYKKLVEAKIPCSWYYHDGHDILEMDNVHITTFKSSKGIEFDTVILPDFSAWKRNIARLNVVNKEDYYVALTRAKRNLYLLCRRVLSGIQISTYDLS